MRNLAVVRKRIEFLKDSAPSDRQGPMWCVYGLNVIIKLGKLSRPCLFINSVLQERVRVLYKRFTVVRSTGLWDQSIHKLQVLAKLR
jgi:hypothetical protein